MIEALRITVVIVGLIGALAGLIALAELTVNEARIWLRRRRAIRRLERAHELHDLGRPRVGLDPKRDRRP